MTIAEDVQLSGEVADILRLPEAGFSSHMTCDEVAEMLGVTETTLRQWARNGWGPPFYGWAKTPFYRVSEVLQWLRIMEPS